MEAFFAFTVPGMGPQLKIIQQQLKKNSMFPAGTRVKREGNDLVFGATFRELFPDVRSAMIKFIYKLGTDTRVDLDVSQTAFVKQYVKYNTQKHKHLEWVMPFNSTGIVYTMTHDADKNCINIGAFSYLHRLCVDMIEEAAYNKQQLITAIDCEDSELLSQTKREIRRAQWPSCFDNITFVHESESEPDPEPKPNPKPESESESEPEPKSESESEPKPESEPEPKTVPQQEQKPAEEPTTTMTVALIATVTKTCAHPTEDTHVLPMTYAAAAALPAPKICWVCDRTMDMCDC